MNDLSTCCSPVSTLEALTPSDIQSSRALISQASSLAFSCLSIALRRIGDKNILPLVHIYLVFLRSLATVEKQWHTLNETFLGPKSVCFWTRWSNQTFWLLGFLGRASLNPRKASLVHYPKISLSEVKYIANRTSQTLGSKMPWFMDDEERILELSSMTETRTERVLWLEFCLVSVRLTLSLTP